MNKMINRYKSKEGGTMIPLRFQTGGSNLFLTMPNGGNVGPMGLSPMGLPEYQTGANYGYRMMQEGGDADMDGDDQSFYSNRMNTFIQKIRDAAEKNLETAIMEQDQDQPMAAYGMTMNSDPMNSYDPGNLGAFGKKANYMKRLGQGAISGYIQRMGALGPNDYYYKEKNIYKDTSKKAPFGTQTFTDADGNQSSISPQEAARRAQYALYSKRDGGALPKAQYGVEQAMEMVRNPELFRRAIEMGHNSVEEYKNSGWGYGKNHPQYKAQSTYPKTVRINDPRTINATTGKPINEYVDLNTGDYHTGVIGQIARAAREYNVDPDELMAMGLQESTLGKKDPNYGHVLHYSDPQRRGPAYDMAYAKTEKNKEAERLGYKDNEVYRIQTYNGLGRLYPETEAKYHGYIMDRAYGVPLPKEGISMLENPLYGKRIMDLRDNILRSPANAEYRQFLDKYNRDLANEEAVSQQQIAAYNLFNSLGPEFGNQYRDMLQRTYNDSISNNSFETFYPGKDLEFNYSIPNLDYDRQKHALDRFNKGIGYEQIPFRDGGALKKYQVGDEVEEEFWSPEELEYLNSISHKDRKDIFKLEDNAGRAKVQEGMKKRAAASNANANSSAQRSSAASANNNTQNSSASATANNTSATANNTGTGTSTEITTANTTPSVTSTKPGAFDGWSKTVIGGVEYPVDDKGRLIGYPYQTPTGPQGYNNYNPYGAYNPYAAYGSMRGRNLGVISKNRLTKDFRENMLAGSYGNPQLLGVSNIETRRAMDPGNRIKSMTFSYGQPISGGRTTINQPAANNSASTPQINTTPPVKSTPAAVPNVSNLTPEQKIQQAMDFTFRPGQGPYNTAPNFPGLEKPKVGPWDADADSWSNPENYVYNTTPSPEVNSDSNIKPATETSEQSYNPELLDSNPAGTIIQGEDGNFYFKDANGVVHTSNNQNNLTQKRNRLGLTGMKRGGSLHKFTKKAAKGMSMVDPCPEGHYWDDVYKKCIPFNKTVPSKEQFLDQEGPYYQYQDELNYRRNRTAHDEWIREQRKKWVDDNFKGTPTIETEDGTKIWTPEYEEFMKSEEYKKIKDQYDFLEEGTENYNPGYQQQDFYSPDKPWDEKSKEIYNELFNTDDPPESGRARYNRDKIKDSIYRQQHPGELIPEPGTDELRDFYKLHMKDMQLTPEQIIRGNYDNWCPCQKKKVIDFVDGRPITQDICVPCEEMATAKRGGSLHRFIRGYQDGGPFSVRDMSIADMPETVDQIVAPESNNTPMEFKPYEMTDADRLRAIEGTNAVDYDPDGMAPAFDVKSKSKKKRIGNPQKDLAAINLATNVLRGKDAAYAATEYGIRSTAANNFNAMRSTAGNYDILSGDFRRGRRAADGNDAFHSGFGTYAQMGGSMLENLKEGDEVYLTEDQINQIIKRGGKLSYL